MRVITWNIHGAKKSSSVWDFLTDLQPDIALLQEVGGSPEHFTKEFDGLCRPAIFKSGSLNDLVQACSSKRRFLRKLRFHPATSGLIVNWIFSEEIW